MASSHRNFILFNLALAGLIGGMVWYLSTEGQTLFINLPSSQPAPLASTTPSAVNKPTTDIAANDAQSIAQLQSQIREEKARAEKARALILARERDRNSRAQLLPSTPPATISLP